MGISIPTISFQTRAPHLVEILCRQQARKKNIPICIQAYTSQK